MGSRQGFKPLDRNSSKKVIVTMTQGVKRTKSGVMLMSQKFQVSGKTKLKLIPYVGCKSGFSHIFDELIPDNYGDKIYDVFGGGGGFTFYACNRFGSKNVIYNDHNPIITNLITALKDEPDKLYSEYQKHFKNSSPDYFLRIRKMKIDKGVREAGRFLYLAKNAFSGKIRFNSKNEFNCPMRKNSSCPQLDYDNIMFLSSLIQNLTITNKDFLDADNIKNMFVYLDPPYLNNNNGHYNAIISLDDFVLFLNRIQKSNNVMISEQNTPDYLLLSSAYRVYDVTLKRSLQYITQNKSNEIIAINYNV